MPAGLTWLGVGNPRDSGWPEASTSPSATAAPALELARLLGVEPDPAPAASVAEGLLPLLETRRVEPLGRVGKPLRAADFRTLIFPSG